MLKRTLAVLTISLLATTLVTPAIAEGSGVPRILTPVDASMIHPRSAAVDVDLSDAPAGDYDVEVVGLPGGSFSPSYRETRTVTNVGESSLTFSSTQSTARGLRNGRL